MLITDDLTITGPGKGLADPEIYDLTISGNNNSRIFRILGTTVEMTGLKLTAGKAEGFGEDGDGGAIYSAESTLILDNMEISNNHADEYGGGLHALVYGQNVEIRSSTISGNQAGITAGGINMQLANNSNASVTATTISDNSVGAEPSIGYWGGGMNCFVSSESQFTLADSTISTNTSWGFGGGLVLRNNGDAKIVNCTVTGNGAAGGAGGLDISDYDEGVTRISHSTIVGNKAGLGIGGLLTSPLVTGGGLRVVGDPYTGSTNTVLDHTIVFYNMDLIDSTSDLDKPTPDVFISTGARIDGGIIATQGISAEFCMIADAKGGLNGFHSSNPYGIIPAGTGGAIAGDPNIDPVLRDNGGPTKTHALLSGSDAINAGDPLAVAGQDEIPEYDQRGPGFTRVYNGRIDIGAYEVQPPIPTEILKVANVTISGSNSTHDPFSFNGPDDQEDFDGSGIQLQTVPVGNANRVEIEFTKEVTNVDINSLTLTRIKGTTLEVFSADVYQTPGPTTRVWQFSSPFVAGHYIITLSDTVTDLSSNRLDGEWINPFSIDTVTDELDPVQVSTFPSGNDEPGGAFRFVFTILPGDANLSNLVEGLDFLIWQRHAGQYGVGFEEGDFDGNGHTYYDNYIWQMNYGVRLVDLTIADFNGDGIVDSLDRDIWNTNYGTTGASHGQGDADGDGDVDGTDFLIWQRQFGLQVVWVD